MRRLLRLPAPAALAATLLVACGGGGGEVWVERLPPSSSGARPLDARATWIDLLELETAPPAGSPGGPTVAHVEIEPPPSEDGAAVEMQRGREHAARVLSDRRGAWIGTPTGASGAGHEHSVDVRAGGVLRAAFGLSLPDGAVAPRDAVVRFAIELDPGDGRRAVARAVLTGDDLSRWHDVRVELPGPGTLTFSARPEGDLDPSVAPAFATPSLELELSRVPDVVLVSVDTLRADHLGCYGYRRPTSPNIDRLAEGGVVFERCISPAPWTLPSYGSLFTSRWPAEHRAGVSGKAEAWLREPPEGEPFSNLAERMAEELPTLAGELARAGYRTAGFYFNPYLNPRAGVARGFDEYAWLGYGARAGVDRALAWLDANRGLPRFLFLHLIDPHWPYAPPAPFDERFAGRSVDTIQGYPWGMKATRNREVPDAQRKLLADLYDGEIAYADDELGRLFEALDASRTLVVFHSDHGEELWDHGRFEHGHSMHDELLHVPLVVAFPPALRPARVASQVRAIDVFPTVLDLLGLDVPDGLRGSSLVPIARGDVTSVHLTAFSESILHGRPYAPFDEAKALATDGWKVVVGDVASGRAALYAPDQRRPESEDVAARHPEVTERLRRELGRIYRDAAERAAEAGVIEFTDEQRAGLGKLGY